MTVSNKDRRMAVKAVDCAIGEWCDENHLGPLTRNVLNATIVNALIAHGWGPPSTVTRERIAERLGPALALNDDLVQLLREHGIEVTDDRPE